MKGKGKNGMSSQCVWCGCEIKGSALTAFDKTFCGVRCRDEYIARYGKAEVARQKKERNINCLGWILIILGLLLWAILKENTEENTTTTDASTPITESTDGAQQNNQNTLSPEEYKD